MNTELLNNRIKDFFTFVKSFPIKAYTLKEALDYLGKKQNYRYPIPNARTLRRKFSTSTYKFLYNFTIEEIIDEIDKIEIFLNKIDTINSYGVRINVDIYNFFYENIQKPQFIKKLIDNFIDKNNQQTSDTYIIDLWYNSIYNYIRYNDTENIDINDDELNILKNRINNITINNLNGDFSKIFLGNNNETCYVDELDITYKTNKKNLNLKNLFFDSKHYSNYINTVYEFGKKLYNTKIRLIENRSYGSKDFNKESPYYYTIQTDDYLNENNGGKVEKQVIKDLILLEYSFLIPHPIYEYDVNTDKLNIDSKIIIDKTKKNELKTPLYPLFYISKTGEYHIYNYDAYKEEKYMLDPCIDYLKIYFMKTAFENIFCRKEFKKFKISIQILIAKYTISVKNPDYNNKNILENKGKIDIGFNYYYTEKFIISELFNDYFDQISNYFNNGIDFELDYMNVRKYIFKSGDNSNQSSQMDPYMIYFYAIQKLRRTYIENEDDNKVSIIDKLIFAIPQAGLRLKLKNDIKGFISDYLDEIPNTIELKKEIEEQYIKQENRRKVLVMFSELHNHFLEYTGIIGEESSGTLTIKQPVGFLIKHYDPSKIFSNTMLTSIAKNIISYDEGLSDSVRNKLSEVATGHDNRCISNSYIALKMLSENKPLKKVKNIREIYCKYYHTLSDKQKTYVKEGKLNDFLLEKTKQDNIGVFLALGYSSETMLCYENGEVLEVPSDNKLLDKRLILLYDKRHLSVMTYENYELMKEKRGIIKNKTEKARLNRRIKDSDQLNFKLSPDILNGYSQAKPIIKVWDIESRVCETTGKQLPSLIICSNTDGSDCKIFYEGDNIITINAFIDYIDSICTKRYTSKTNVKTRIEQILLYSYGGCRYDNLLIHKQLKQRNYNTSACYDTRSSIKFMKYHNVQFIDLNCFYSGALRTVFKETFTCKINGVKHLRDITFIDLDGTKQTKQIGKTYFPYDFLTKETLNYNGPIPSEKFWINEKYADDKDGGRIKVLSHYNEFCKGKSSDYIYDMKKEIIEYCFYDCIILGAVVKEFTKLCYGKIKRKDGSERFLDLRGVKTAASLAIKYFRQAYLDCDIYGTTDKALLEIERSTYFGGCTERYKREFISTPETPYLNYYDINSSYPASMMLPMPYKYLDSKHYLTLTITKENVSILKRNWIYKARVGYVGNDRYYISPILNRAPNGNMIALLNSTYRYMYGCEIIRAVESGCEAYITDYIEYEPKELFSEYIGDIYKKKCDYKKEGKAALSGFNKLLANSTSGKFGQQPKVNRELIINNDEIELHDKIKRSLSNNLNSFIDIEELDDEFSLLTTENINNDNNIGSLVRIVAYITAESRCALHKAMEVVGFENVYNADTDSIFTTKELTPEMIDEERLGAFKLEHKIIDATFVAKKTYHIIDIHSVDHNKAKGVKSTGLTKEDYKKMINGEKVSVTSKTFFRSLNGIKVSDQTRFVGEAEVCTRKFEGNNSVAYDNMNEYILAVKNSKNVQNDKNF